MGSYLNRVRKRYTVTIEAKGEVQQIVVIAYTPKAMYNGPKKLDTK